MKVRYKEALSTSKIKEIGPHYVKRLAHTFETWNTFQAKLHGNVAAYNRKAKNALFVATNIFLIPSEFRCHVLPLSFSAGSVIAQGEL